MTFHDRARAPGPAHPWTCGALCLPPSYLVEVGVPRGRQLEALLAALMQQDAAQQLVGRPHVVAEEWVRVPRGVAQRLGQPQGPVTVHPRRVPAQLLVLGRGASARLALGPSPDSESTTFQGKHPCQKRTLKIPKPQHELGLMAVAQKRRVCQAKKHLEKDTRWKKGESMTL